MIQKKYTRYFIAANIAILCSTAALMCIPICVVKAQGREKIFSVCVALVFWSGLFFSCFFNWRCNLMLKKYGKKSKKTKLVNRSGILSFAENKYMLVIDIGMVIAVLFFAVILLIDIQNDWVVMTDIAMMFMTIGLHCVDSGKIR